MLEQFTIKFNAQVGPIDSSQLKSGPVGIKRRIKQRKVWGIKKEYEKPTKFLTWNC